MKYMCCKIIALCLSENKKCRTKKNKKTDQTKKTVSQYQELFQKHGLCTKTNKIINTERKCA